MLNVFKKLETEGYPVKEMHHIVFADWELGGMEALAAAGYHNVHVLYIVRDIVAAFVHTGRWPHKHLADVERRFAAFRQK
jgi:hypothetical protein